MSEVLSQSEIDDLLKALSTGELDVEEIKENTEVQVKNYDFARPAKFSKEHLRTLEIIFEHYGRLLYTNLPAYLRKNVQVDVRNSEAVVYSEFANALSNPVLLGIVDFAPLQGNMILELAPSLGYAIIDRLLGGTGETLEKKREFSEIEITIIERIITICIDLLIEPWKNVIQLEPRLERIETNSQFAQIIAPSVPRNLKKVRTIGSSGRTQAASSSSASVAGVQAGQMIEHERFGLGEVIKVEGTGDNAKATIHFKNAGDKQLLLRFARFKVVE